MDVRLHNIFKLMLQFRNRCFVRLIMSNYNDCEHGLPPNYCGNLLLAREIVATLNLFSPTTTANIKSPTTTIVAPAAEYITRDNKSPRTTLVSPKIGDSISVCLNDLAI